MSKQNVPKLINQALEMGQGILRLAPTWVPRSFCVPGRRIKLHPDDYMHSAASVEALMNAGLHQPLLQTTAL